MLPPGVRGLPSWKPRCRCAPNALRPAAGPERPHRRLVLPAASGHTLGLKEAGLTLTPKYIHWRFSGAEHQLFLSSGVLLSHQIARGHTTASSPHTGLHAFSCRDGRFNLGSARQHTVQSIWELCSASAPQYSPHGWSPPCSPQLRYLTRLFSGPSKRRSGIALWKRSPASPRFCDKTTSVCRCKTGRQYSSGSVHRENLKSPPKLQLLVEKKDF